MKNNQRGGIKSKIIIIPAGVVLLAGLFFSGYYLGKHQNKSGTSGEAAQPLPAITPGTGQKQEEFTFYKTLTDRNDKTVSIELNKPRPVAEEIKPDKLQIIAGDQRSISVLSVPNEKRIPINFGKEASPSARPNKVASKQPQPPAKKDRAAASKNAKLRYTIQTASYPERALADAEVKRLKKRGYAAYIVSSELPGKGMRHRVRIGSFSKKAAAEKLQKMIHKKERILAIVVPE